jgi:methylmalonyl-CoA mutase N-terminal domain/subunit
VLRGIERNWFQREIAEAAFREQQRYESGDLVKVGVTEFVEPDEPIDTLVIAAETELEQAARVRALRARRDSSEAARALGDLARAARSDRNLMEPLIACARAKCTEGEITRELAGIFGTYKETSAF